jgi:FK506-binding protein 14
LQLTPSGLGVEHVSKPEVCERTAKNGDVLTMHYTGTLEDGKKFDSSYDRSEPFKFQIGVGQVIKGWEEGVLGMCVGKKRRLLLLHHA